MRRTGNCTGGSNPPLSAKEKRPRMGPFFYGEWVGREPLFDKTPSGVLGVERSEAIRAQSARTENTPKRVFRNPPVSANGQRPRLGPFYWRVNRGLRYRLGLCISHLPPRISRRSSTISSRRTAAR